jgi:hypothetical protein
MHDAMVEAPQCVRTDDFDNCGYPTGAVLYFVTYIIAMGYIFTNLFVAAILDHVTFGTVNETALVGPTHLWDFQALWTRFDPRAEGFIGAHRVRSFLRHLGAPLGRDSGLGFRV